uniref:Uncharacterized protein n=1 Tax=Salmo trutta TaxID=8032 RepID=A0A673WLA2_SALTR
INFIFRYIQGLHAPLKLKMNYSAFILFSDSALALDTFRGRDESFGFEDILNDQAQCELMGEPHFMMQYKLGCEDQ